MKKSLLFLLLLFFGLSIHAETNLIIWKKDDSKVAFVLTEKPMLTFSESSLMINTAAISVCYDLENLAKITYELSSEEGIRNIENDKKSSFKLDGGMLLVPSLRPGSVVSIHSLNGILVFRKSIETVGSYSFPLSHLNMGVYLVSVDSLTYKIMKK